MEKKEQQQSYENYVRQKTPVHNLPVIWRKHSLQAVSSV